MSEELVKRLRANAATWEMDDKKTCDDLDEAADAIERLEARVKALEDALTDIGIYGCGMLNQPAALNGPNEAWLEKRIAEYERRARAALEAKP